MPEPRLQEIVVENFRSISGKCVIPLDGSITLIHGANGAGKTSLLSAIELGATGRVGFLDEQIGDARALLRNHDYPLGRVRLSIADGGTGSRVGAFELNADQVSGEAALNPAEQVYFLERSFLPQTALGRLLESYTETGKQVDTALVRFVKSLVGLDDLDALIDGLHASGDLRRSRKAVPAWARTSEEVESIQRRRREIAAELDGARARLKAAFDTLQGLMETPGSVKVEELLRIAVERGRDSESSRADLAELEELQAKVDAIANLSRQLESSESTVSGQLDVTRAEEAQSAYRAWEEGPGAAALAELNQIRQDSLRLPLVRMSQVGEAYKESIEIAAEASRQHSEAVAADQARAEKIDTLDRRIEVLEQEIAETEKRARSVDVPTDVRVLIEILQLAVPLVDSDRCPLCDQKFAGAGTLSDHLAAKLGRLSAGSQELLLIERELNSLRSDHQTAVKQVILFKSLPPVAAGSPLDKSIRSLNSLGDSVGQGARLLRDVQSTQARSAELAAREAQRLVVRERVTQVCEALGLSTDDVPGQAPDETLGREISARIQKVRYADIQRGREREAREAVEDSHRDVERLERASREAELAVSRVRSQLSTAESRMASARELLQVSEQTRSTLINQVFDQSLNSLWAQLFGRFAPSEKFTPRFVKQTSASRSVDVRLETALPDGRTSGSPGAMLSYGNTNSAALALFMALHLSAPPQLPWLIFDDPVQSMDEIHVANFAAIVRQLAFVHERQVVIAIHQPELFDYLALELAPSTSDHSLVRATLDRGAGTTSARIERIDYAPESVLHGAL
ncbi:AAA family ATPase [Agromyces albus]|nr:AAA family ATPase [Agromyces albus]